MPGMSPSNAGPATGPGANPAPRRIILALPAYNEAENLRPLLAKARETFAAMGVRHDIVVVDDGSTDATPAVLAELAAAAPADAPLHIVTHAPNRGLGGAIVSGLKRSLELLDADPPADGRHAIVVCMDADDTHDPGYIPGMADKIWADTADIVIASRFREGSKEVGVPFGRLVLSRGARLLFRIFLRLPDVRDYTCGYRAYRVSLLRDAAAKYGDRLVTRQGFACTDEILVKLSTLTKRISEVPFVLRYDKKRTPSKLPLFKTIVETLKMLVFKE